MTLFDNDNRFAGFNADSTAEEYLELIKDWQDPNPKPVIEKHDRFLVVRDDLLGYGAKIRALDYLVGHAPEYAHVQEWVYGAAPASGYAQVSLPFLCGKYDKKAVVFMAKRDPSKLHESQKRGIAAGGIYHWVDSGMINVTKKRASDYVNERPESRALLPMGLDHPTAIACIIKVARSLGLKPPQFWTAGSSGTFNRGLQKAWPDSEAHVVSVGHTMSPEEIGRAVFHRSTYKFDKDVKPYDEPPFPSVRNYDAKVWRILNDEGLVKALWWNIA